MINTILVPLAGSTPSESALPYACRLARQTGAQLILVRAAPYTAESAMSTSDLHTVDPQLRVTLRDAELYLEAIQERLKIQGLPSRAEALDTDAVGAILFTARRYGADLIVMAASGRSGVQRALVGSVTQHVVHGTNLPVLLVREGVEQRVAEEVGPFRRILVALDGTVLAEAVVTYLAGEPALLSNAAVVLLGVVSPVSSGPNEEDLRRYLALAGRRFPENGGLDLQIAHGWAGEAILDAARREGVDLIVLATHGRIGLDRLIHGSTAYHVVHATPVPVLLLHESPITTAAEQVEA